MYVFHQLCKPSVNVNSWTDKPVGERKNTEVLNVPLRYIHHLTSVKKCLNGILVLPRFSSKLLLFDHRSFIKIIFVNVYMLEKSS